MKIPTLIENETKMSWRISAKMTNQLGAQFLLSCELGSVFAYIFQFARKHGAKCGAKSLIESVLEQNKFS